MNFFFYGTLMDDQVRTTVLGRSLAGPRLSPAMLKGFRRVRMAGAPYPLLVKGMSTDWVDGLLALGLSAADAARLIRYEGAAYFVTTVPIETSSRRNVAARIFMPRRHVQATGESWSIERWRRNRSRLLSAP